MEYNLNKIFTSKFKVNFEPEDIVVINAQNTAKKIEENGKTYLEEPDLHFVPNSSIIASDIVDNSIPIGNIITVDRNKYISPIMEIIADPLIDRRESVLWQKNKTEQIATIDIVKNGISVLPSTFKEFILESAEETTTEKYQIVETFDDFYVFFYGTRPKIFSYSGRLLNFENLPWLEKFKNFYERYKGTKLADSGYMCYISYDQHVYRGYILNFRFRQDITSNAIPFAFDFLIIDGYDAYDDNSFITENVGENYNTTYNNVNDEDKVLVAKNDDLAQISKIISRRLPKDTFNTQNMDFISISNNTNAEVYNMVELMKQDVQNLFYDKKTGGLSAEDYWNLHKSKFINAVYQFTDRQRALGQSMKNAQDIDLAWSLAGTYGEQLCNKWSNT